ncbi:MAG: enoyl-CoA hydratase-related protein [Dehalococcoidia bacterium]
MTFKNITYEKRDNIGYVKLNRAEASNSINRAMADELQICCQSIYQDDDVRVTVLGAEGDTFSVADSEPDPSASRIASEAIGSLKCPVVAAINGDATGSGLDLALACDLRLAGKDARFGFPEVSQGIIPSGGGTQRLPRIVGRGKALEMILTAAIIDADEAWRMGLINRVVEPGQLDSEVEQLAEKLASKGPIAERYGKEAISKGMDMTLGQGLGLEADLSFLLHSTGDRTEGIKAFQEKRTPEFSGE